MGCLRLEYAGGNGTVLRCVWRRGDDVKFRVDWYDYGARMYDPQLGRFHVKDPLMEWHFKQTPYHYCLNNPIFYIDPFGLDTVPANKLDWEKFDPDEDVVELPEVTVTGSLPVDSSPTHRKPITWAEILAALYRFEASYSGSSFYTKPFGIVFTSLSGGSHENSTARRTSGRSIPIDDILALRPDAGPKSFGFDPLSPAKSIKSASNAVKEARGTSDGEIVKNYTGTGPKTDSSGRPVSKITSPGGESDSLIITKTILFDDVEGNTYQDYKIHRWTRRGRSVSGHYKKR